MPRIATVRLKTASEQKCRANGPQKKSGAFGKKLRKNLSIRMPITLNNGFRICCVA
jgi:hypothetical protein